MDPLKGTLPKGPDNLQVTVQANETQQEDADVHGDVEEHRRVSAVEGA